MPIDLRKKLRFSAPLLLATASLAFAGCAADADPSGGATESGGSTPDDETASPDPGTNERAADGPWRRDLKPVVRDGRQTVVGDDGNVHPLLTLDELRETVGGLRGLGGVQPDVEDYKTLADPPATWDLSIYQTPIKDQADRGSCGSFATVGAIEAAYKRTYGITLDLSEQYMFHVSKSTTVDYPRIFRYENQSSYWYGGGWVDVAATYMLPLDSYAPYAGKARCPSGNPACTLLNSIPGASSLAWHGDPALNFVTQQQVDDFEYSPLHIPAAARENARYGVLSYSQLDSIMHDTTALEGVIANNREVVLAATLNWSDDDRDGIMEYNAAIPGEGHVLLLIGYNHAQHWFLAKSSWGGTAPSAYIKIDYDFVRNSAYSAASVNSVVPPTWPIQQKARWMGKWHQDHDGWYGTMVIRRLTPPSNTAVRFGSYYNNGSYSSGHSVNGQSMDSNFGLKYYIATETENAPGTLTGQRFEADIYNYASTNAAGIAFVDPSGWAGLLLGRTRLTMPYSNSFIVGEWAGIWDINMNGNLGVLTISSISAPPTGPFILNLTLFQGGVYKTITGTVDRTLTGRATLVVASGGTTYTHVLNYHFWEDKLASGYTTSAGLIRAGVHAVKR